MCNNQLSPCMFRFKLAFGDEHYFDCFVGNWQKQTRVLNTRVTMNKLVSGSCSTSLKDFGMLILIFIQKLFMVPFLINLSTALKGSQF